MFVFSFGLSLKSLVDSAFPHKSWFFEIWHHLYCFLVDSFRSIYIAFTTKAVPKTGYKIQCKTLAAVGSRRIKPITFQVFKPQYSACLSHDTMAVLNNIPVTVTAIPVDSSGDLPPVCLHLVKSVAVFNPTLSGSCLFSVLCCDEFIVWLCVSCKCNKYILCSTSSGCLGAHQEVFSLRQTLPSSEEYPSVPLLWQWT